MADEQQGGGDPPHPDPGSFPTHPRLPAQGRPAGELLAELESIARQEDARWRTGKISGTYYHGGDEHRTFLNRVFSLFSHVNVLQSDLCPSMARFESEIVSMTAQLLGAEAAAAGEPAHRVVGSVTSGGSESIMLAMKVYRDRGRQEKKIADPEIVIPATAHPAFLKAGQYYGIRMVRVPVGPPDFRVEPAAVQSALGPRTVAIAGSAGNYPYGLVDPLQDLSDIALKHDLGLHVDGCLGGFILPWIERLGHPVPTFDFRLPGVTSISADTHKYGFGLKGSSVLLFRNRELRRYQFFQVPDWSGGLYASPTSAGSRSGGLTASTWASLVRLGEAGYLEAARAIMRVAAEIREAVQSIEELILIGEPTFLVSFRSEAVDVLHVNDFMRGQGWRFNCLQLPPALHFCVTMPQTLVPGLGQSFAADLRQAVHYAKSRAGTPAQSSALYGLAGSVEGNRAASELMLSYLEALYDS